MEAVLRDHILPLLAARGTELRAFSLLIQNAARGAPPDLATVEPGVLITGSIATASLMLLATRSTRRALLALGDTVVAVALLALITALLLALPIGTLYVSYRGLLFLAASLADTYPILARLLPKIPPPA